MIAGVAVGVYFGLRAQVPPAAPVVATPAVPSPPVRVDREVVARHVDAGHALAGLAGLAAWDEQGKLIYARGSDDQAVAEALVQREFYTLVDQRYLPRPKGNTCRSQALVGLVELATHRATARRRGTGSASASLATRRASSCSSARRPTRRSRRC